MTPQQKIMHLALVRVATHARLPIPHVTDDNVNELYDAFCESGSYFDDMNEIREGEVETGLPCGWSRNYESKAVATRMPDGSWVGWTYWYGGGKHGEPESINWLEDAYDLNCSEEEKVVVVRTFSKPDLKPVP